MTQTPFRPMEQNEPASSRSHDYHGRESASSAKGSSDDHVAIVPVQRMKNSQETGSSLTSQAGTLVNELGNLRSNIDIMTEQLQSLLATERAAVERAELLNAMTSHIRESLNLEYIFNATVEDARNALQADRVVVYQFIDHDYNGKIVAESCDRRFPSVLGAQMGDTCFASRYAKLYEKGRIQAVNDIYEAGLAECHIKQLQPFQVKANLVAPLLVGQKLHGLLIAHQCSAPRNWSESEIEFFRQLAIQVGYALDQALLLEQQRLAAQQAQWLNQINLRIRESLELDNIFNAAVKETRAALQCDRVIVYRFDPQWHGTIVAEDVDRQWPTALGANIADPCFADRYVQMYLKGRVQATNDIYDAGLTECHLNQLKPFGVKANLVVPIIANQQLLGLLIAHQCSAPRMWKSNEIELLRQVGVQLGYAIDQAFALQQQEIVAKQAKLLNDLTSRIGSLVDIHEIFDVVVDDTRESLGADRVVIYQLAGEEEGVIVAESLGTQWSLALNKTFTESGLDERYLKQVQRGRIVTINDLTDAGLTDVQQKKVKALEIKSMVLVPIIVDKELYGLLVAHQCSNTRNWQESETSLLKQLTNQMSFAIERVNLIKQRQATIERSQRLNQISGRIQEATNMADIFNAAVEELRDVIQADRVIVYEFDAKWHGLIVAESVEAGFPLTLNLKTHEAHITDRLAKAYMRGKVTAYDNIYSSDLIDCHINQLAQYGVKSNLFAGIVAKGQLYGLLIAHQCSAPRKWQESETELIKQVALQVGYALDQKFLLQEQQAAAVRSRKINEISFRIRESLDTDRIFRTGVEESLKLMNCDRVVVYRFDANWDGRIVYEAVKVGWRKLTEMQVGDVPCFPEDYVEPYRQGRVQITEDVSQAGLTACHEEQLGKWQVKANVVVPIVVNQKLYGLLGAHQCSGTRKWDPPEVEAFRQVALQLGYALDQALLLEEVQQSSKKAEQAFDEQRHQKEVLQGQIEKFLEQIEESFEGDLTVRASVTEGEMGTVADFFNATLENLQKLVQQVQTATTVTTNTAQASETEVKNLSSEALRQAETITGALSKIQQMNNSIQTVAANAQDAKMKAQLASKTLQDGDLAMNRTVQGILAIQQTVEATARKVKNLGEASQKISRVVSLIRELANQTNLLALNASVEATRAGEDEQGFAVANEVRTLAEQSANATKEIEEIVEEIQAETNAVVQAMDIGRKRVLIGTKLVKGTRQTLTDLSQVSTQIREVVEGIAQSATAQAQTSNEISQTMQDVAGISKQTSEQSVKVAESFSKLLELAKELQNSVAQFKIR